MEINYVTSNQKKFDEAYHILIERNKECRHTLVHAKLHLQELQGTAEEIALHKVKHAYDYLKKPVLIDDISIHCTALNGLPGPYIKSFLEAIGDEGLYQLISHYTDRRVEAICTIAFFTGQDEPQLFQGKAQGCIVAPHGAKTHHGATSWNRIVQIDGYTTTCADMSLEELSKISPRNNALQKFNQYLYMHHLDKEPIS